MKDTYKLTVITPTTGKDSLFNLIDSIKKQDVLNEVYHIIMWDDFRSNDDAINSPVLKSENILSLYIPGSLGKVWGSHLRAVALNIAHTDYVTFSDDDVWWEPDYLETIKSNIIDKSLDWGGCRRIIWNPETRQRIGLDNFESIGFSQENVKNRVPYEMLDGNCMIFKREFGVYASPLYREIQTYGDDRLLYNYLKENSDSCLLMNKHIINQYCPNKLIPMFTQYCEK